MHGRMIRVLMVAAGLLPSAPAFGDDAEGLSVRFREAARRVLPAVVTVRAVGLASVAGPVDAFPPGEIEPRDAGASGVVIDAAKGLILTNDHVVRGAPRVAVTLADGRERLAREVRRDPRSDLALLIVNPDHLEGADWGDSDALDLGDWVLAIGQPFGLAGTVTAGIVSGKGRGIGAVNYEDLIQTDAAINPGNSGGPLVNLRGQVVGINLAIKTLGGGYEGVGFAVPAGRARRVAADLAEFGRVRRSSIGVLIARVDPETAERIGRPGAVMITAVALLSPAAEAGLRVRDVILRVAGHPARGVGMLQGEIETARVGEPLRLAILRGDREIEVHVRPIGQIEPAQMTPLPTPDVRGAATPPSSRNATSAATADARNPTRFPELGLRLSEPTPDLAARYGYEPQPGGLFVRGVEPDGPADRGGLEIGMVITDAAGAKVKTLADFRASLARRPAGGDLILRILKGSKAEFRVLLGDGSQSRPQPPPAAIGEGNGPPAAKL
jgi:serine protease Do